MSINSLLSPFQVPAIRRRFITYFSDPDTRTPNQPMKDVYQHNQRAWNREAENAGEWSLPVSSETIANARNGKWSIRLTPRKDLPESWFSELQGCRVLCMAGGGGQQGPLLAATGADVAVLDASEQQLKLDRRVAQEHDLPLTTVLGDMAKMTDCPASRREL